MAFDVKKVQSLSEQSIADLKTIEKLGDLEHLSQLSDELKRILADGNLEEISPMLPPYITEIRKNIGFLLGNYKSIRTHAINRTKELSALMDQLSRIK